MLEWFQLLPVYPLILISNGERRGSPEIFYWYNSRFSSGPPSSLHLLILQNSYFSCFRVLPCLWESVQFVTQHTVFTCNFLPCLNFLLSCPLAPFFSNKEVCWLASMIYSCDLKIHYDRIRFLGVNYCQNSRENADLSKQKWNVHLLF